MSVAVCDPWAFYPFRSLVNGPFTDLSQLAEVERFVRTVVLHDEMLMELDPLPYDPYSEQELSEEERQGDRNVIVALGPVLTGYDIFKQRHSLGKTEMPDLKLSPALIEEAQKFSNAKEGNVYYETHIEYLKRIVNLVQRGGSALIKGEFGRSAIKASSKYPGDLFNNLDKDWQKFAREADSGDLGLIVPPVLSIVLTRCEKRTAIPDVLRDLRDEWASARAKVWTLLHQLKTVQTIQEMRAIQQELTEASLLFSPVQNPIDSRPVRVLWDLVVGAVSGAVTSSLSGGNLGIGAAIGATISTASRSVPPLIHELGPVLFGRGAFDLAKRVRKEVLRVEYSSLSKFLTEAEKEKLQL